MEISYKEVISLIKSQCEKVNITFSSDGDGRITSAIKEKEYLDILEKNITKEYPSITITRPKERFWYDIRINNIPINLKLTTGGTDNAFNKIAIYYTICGLELTKKNMNYNQWYKLIKECNKKTKRDHATEYHYLVVDKDSGKIILKSILDIHSYKTNPCNILQINWKNEFTNIKYTIENEQFNEKIQELMKAIQKSIKQSVESMKQFIEADIQKDFRVEEKDELSGLFEKSCAVKEKE